MIVEQAVTNQVVDMGPSSEKMHAICDCFSASFFAHRRRSALAVMLSKA